MKEIVVDFRHSSASCHHHMLWQALFDLYVSHGGELANMHEMLIDLSHCQHILRRVQDDKASAVKFVWMCSAGSYMTELLEAQNWVTGCPVQTAQLQTYDYAWVCTVNKDGAVIAPLVFREPA